MKNTITLALLSFLAIACKPEIIAPSRPDCIIPVKSECDGKPSMSFGNDVFCVGTKVMNGPDRTLGLGLNGTYKTYANIGVVTALVPEKNILKVTLSEQSEEYKYPEKTPAFYGKGYKCITAASASIPADYRSICVGDKVFDTNSYHRQWGYVQEVYSNGWARVWLSGSNVEVSADINNLNKTGSLTLKGYAFSCDKAIVDQGKDCTGVY